MSSCAQVTGCLIKVLAGFSLCISMDSFSYYLACVDVRRQVPRRNPRFLDYWSKIMNILNRRFESSIKCLAPFKAWSCWEPAMVLQAGVPVLRLPL